MTEKEDKEEDRTQSKIRQEVRERGRVEWRGKVDEKRCKSWQFDL